ncbi:MAG: hypothetical protein ABR968_15030 [Bacteroidales bacterium]|jgi:hypothetical protein
MAKIIFKGSGQLNGSIPIDKTVEIEEDQIGNFTGANRDEAIIDLLAIYYPGVRIDPKHIGINILFD